jgi:hypothetical protein
MNEYFRARARSKIIARSAPAMALAKAKTL